MCAKKIQQKKSLTEKFPPSRPCNCKVCLSYCLRPGWWTVEEAAKAIEADYAMRMMIELSPDKSFGVISPAFKGNEGAIALSLYSKQGCNFLTGGLCELHGTGLMPLECRFCHHDRKGLGPKCHEALEKDWNTPAGKLLIEKWCIMIDLKKRMNTFGLV